MPDSQSERLRERLKRCSRHVEEFQATIYRVCEIRYANQADLLTGIGAKLQGARWNPPGQLCAIYGSRSPQAALGEVAATARRVGVPLKQRTPLVMVAIRVRLSAILDVANGAVRRLLNVSKDRMVSVNWDAEQRAKREAVTQTIGRLAFEEGLEGLVVPSTRLRNESNLVIFPQRLRSGSRVEIVNEEELPQRREVDSGQSGIPDSNR
jgi:RES domain-containing protein